MVIRVNHSAFGTILLLTILTLQVEFQSVKAEPGTLVVPDQYAKIEWAIGNATSGDTIFVLSGTYYEHLTINKPLILLGENKESTIIDGLGENQTIINTTADNIVVSGFTVQNTSLAAGTSYAGIRVSGRSCNITGNFVTKTKMGIFATSQRSRITENIVKNCGHGVALHSSSEVAVEANNVSVNTVGISLALSSNNVIIGNRAANSSTGGHGIILSTNSFGNTICENELMYNYHGMWLSSSFDNFIINNTIANNELLGIELANSPNNIVYHNNFINNGLPPLAPNIKHIVIQNSTSIWDNGYPSGGNYWHDYTDVDDKKGSNQDQLGSDEIWDHPYSITENNQDRYPSVKSYGGISHLILDKTKPTANAGQNQTARVGEKVSFNASKSADNVGIVSYFWSFDDGTNDTGVFVTHTYITEGIYSVVLTVRDDAGNSDTDIIIITVVEGFPYLYVAVPMVILTIITATLFWRHKVRSKERRQRKMRSRIRR